MQDYLEYMYSNLVSSNVILSSLINKEDEIYLAYKNSKLSLSQFLQYAITQNWINLDLLGIGVTYHYTDEIYEILVDYAMNLLIDNATFEKKIYRTLIFTKKLTGKEICLLLNDQGVLECNESDIEKLNNGRISAYDFLIDKLTKIEITPAQLALEPCSGSIVLADVKNGDVLALVTYPSYDNNYLANKIDWDYYQKLLNDKSTPLLNRAMMQKTTTGSTIKPLTALAGLDPHSHYFGLLQLVLIRPPSRLERQVVDGTLRISRASVGSGRTQARKTSKVHT
jgi:penicillin-binding protein 2